MTMCEALDALHAAYDARDAAMSRAVAEVERQFAPIVAKRVREFQDAVRRATEADDGRSAMALGNPIRETVK